MSVGSGGIVEVFLPSGGSDGQVLQKVDTQDYNFTWGAGGGGGGAIASISAGTTYATGPVINFQDSPTVSFGVNGNTVTAFANVTAAPSPVNVTGANGSSVNAQTIAFSNANGMSLGVSTAVNGATITGSYTVPTQTQFVLSNSNGLSFGTNGSTVTGSYSVPSTAGLLSAINVSAGTTSSNLSALTFSNSNGLAFGLNAGVVTGSYTVPSQTNQTAGIYASSQTMGQSSSGTYDARSLTVVGSGDISVGWSNSSLVVSGSTYPAQSTQPVAVSGSNGSFAFSTLTMGNLNGLSHYTSNGSIVGSYTVPSTAGLISAVNVSAGTTSNNLSAFTFSNANGISFGLNASTLTASYTVPTQSVQSIGLYASSQTTAQSSSSTVDARSFSIVGMGGVSVGLSGGSFVVSGATGGAGGGGFTGGVSTGGNTIGNTGTQTGQIVFAGGNNITLSVSTDVGGAQTISISGANAGGAQTGISSLIAGQSQTVGALSFSNANGVSFGIASGANTGTLTASVAAQTNQTLGIYGSSQTVGQSSSSTYDARSLTIVGQGEISVGWSNSSLIISAAADVAQTGISGIVVSNTTYTSGTITFQNANGISFGSSGANGISASYTVPAQTNQTAGIYASSQTFGQSSSSTHDARSLSIVGSGAVSVGWSNSSLLISGSTYPAQTNQTGGIYVTAQSTGQSSSSTYDLRTLSMVGDGIVSIGWSNSTLRVSATQSNQAFSASGGSSAFQTLSFSNANGFTFSNNAGQVQGSYTVPVTAGLISGTFSAYAQGNTTQSSSGTMPYSSLQFSGAGIASVGVSNGQVVISVPAGGGGGDGYNIVSMLTATSGGATAGATFSTLSGSIGLMAGSNIQLSQTSNTIVIGADAYNIIAVPGTTAAVDSNVVFSNSNGVSFGLNGNTMTASVNAGGGAAATVSVYEPSMRGQITANTLANGTWYFQPVMLSQNVSAYQLVMQQSMSTQSATTFSVSGSVSGGNASSGSYSYGVSGTAAIFSRYSTGTDANSTRIISLTSASTSYSYGMSESVSWSTNVSSATVSFTTSAAFGFLANIDSVGGVTTSSVSSSGSSTFSSTSTAAQSISSSFSNSYASGLMSGIRPNYIPWVTSFGVGEYWIGIRQSTNTGSTSMNNLTRVGSMAPPAIVAYTTATQGFAELGNAASFATSNLTRGWGSGNMDSVTSTTFGLNSISNMSNYQTYFQMVAKTN